MNFNAIICEYNPFHNGHKYHIQRVKELTNKPVAAIMSGSFTQRGDVAITDKFARAETAIANGIDLVIELPTVWATGSAETFAKGGVAIAEGMGCVDTLCFSAENADKSMLIKAANAFEDERFRLTLRRNMDKGMYYPQAVENAMSEVFSGELSEIVKSPNNILGLEYIKASKTLDFLVTERKGAEHDSADGENDIRSASEIRRMILSGEEYSEFTPSRIKNPADINRLERVILYKLRTMSADDFKALPDVTEGLENRFSDAVRSSVSVDEILDKVKTKRYTMARLRRIIIYALLGITKETSLSSPPYIRVLAFNKDGVKIMSEIKKRGSLPLITNTADGYKALGDEAKRIFDIDTLATDLHSLACEEISACGDDFMRKVTII